MLTLKSCDTLNGSSVSASPVGRSQLAPTTTAAHDATFVCPSSSSSFSPYNSAYNQLAAAVAATTSSANNHFSICTYPTLKQECSSSGSSSTVTLPTDWSSSPLVTSTTTANIPTGPAASASLPVHFMPAALIRVVAKPNHEDNMDYAVLELNKLETTIGRDSCDYSIVSVEISRKHALIKYEQNRWWIIDLQSTNGLFINGVRVRPTYQTQLMDGCTISFGPESNCNFKYLFRECYGVVAKHLGSKFPISAPLPAPVHVDQSGYETATTQEMNPPHPPPPLMAHPKPVSLLDLHYQLNYSRAEISRLKGDRAKLEAHIQQQKEHCRNMTRDFEYNQRKLAEKELEANKKSQKFDSLIVKYRTLCEQLEETQKTASQSRSQPSSDDEFVCSGGLTPGTMSSVLKEMTCSICTEYLIAPTSLSCSHVFCQHCIDTWRREYSCKYNSISSGICPVCRKEVQCQTQVLLLENIISILLDAVLDDSEKQNRAKLIEKRRQVQVSKSSQNPCAMPGSGSSPSSLGSFIQQILAGFPRSRRQSIVITSDSDSDDDSDDEVHVDEPHLVDLEAALQAGARRIRRLSDQEVIALDERPARSSPEVMIQDDDVHVVNALSSDEEIEEEYDISFTVNNDRARGRRRRRHSSRTTASGPRIALSLDSGEDSNDDEVEEIFMLGDDSDLDSNDSFLSHDSSGSEELFLFDLDDDLHQRTSSRNSQIEPIVISDSEESQMQAILPPAPPAAVQGSSSSAAATASRRSSMIILSDSEDSLLPALSTAAAVSGPSSSNSSSRRPSRSRQNGLSTDEIVVISPDQAAPGGGNGRRRGSGESSAYQRQQQQTRAHRHNRQHQPYRRGDPSGRTSQNQNFSQSTAAAVPRRATLAGC